MSVWINAHESRLEEKKKPWYMYQPPLLFHPLVLRDPNL